MTDKQHRRLSQIHDGYVALRGLTEHWKEEAQDSLHRATLELRDLNRIISSIKKQLANGR